MSAFPRLKEIWLSNPHAGFDVEAISNFRYEPAIACISDQQFMDFISTKIAVFRQKLGIDPIVFWNFLANCYAYPTKVSEVFPKTNEGLRESAGEEVEAQTWSDPLIARWFEVDGTPRWIVNYSRELVAANATARQILERGLIFINENGVLTAANTLDATRVRQTLFDALTIPSAVTVLRGLKKTKPVVLTARVFGGEAKNGPFWAISLNEAQNLFAPGALANALDYFDLTPAEKVVVQSLFDTPNTEVAAQRLSLSTHTINAHLRKIFSKLHCKSKSDVILTVVKALTEGPQKPALA